MQNTARGQAHPNTLIKNFFIVGVKQEELQQVLFEGDTLKTNIEAIEPEVLFSMYTHNDDCFPCIGHCFPQKIQVNFSSELSVPKFFTFVQTNEMLEQQYYHTFTYYEQISKSTIVDDYDRAKQIHKQNMLRKEKRKAAKNRMSQSVKDNRASSMVDDDAEDDALAFDDSMDSKEQERIIREREARAKMENQKKNRNQWLDQTRTSKQSLKNKINEDGSLSRIKEHESEDEPQVTNVIASMISTGNDQQSNSDARGQERSDSHNDSSLMEADVDDVNMYIPIAFVIQTEVEYHDIFRELSLDLFESIRKTPDNPKNKNGEEIKLPFLDRRKMAFADFIAKIAFLKTVPCPSFNTKFNIELHNKTLVIQEGPFNRIPNNNDIALKLLFQILDVKAIFFCWKALLFDYSLVLISSQYSLQFNIAEALKQLMFPLTWQNAYIQPANKEKVELVESPAPVFLCASDEDFRECSNGLSAFEYLEQLRESELVTNLAICDIDGCITNESALNNPKPKEGEDPKEKKKIDTRFPPFNMETFFIKNLNILYKQHFQTFDQAYPDHNRQQQEREFCMDVRKLFFNILKPFLEPLTEVENPSDPNSKPAYFKKVDSNDVSAVFDKYFERQEYMYLFDDEDEKDEEKKYQYRFAQKLVSGSPFQHFCDDHLNEEITNYKVFKAIIQSRPEEVVTETNVFEPASPLTAHTAELPKKRNLTSASVRHNGVVREETNPILAKISKDFEVPDLMKADNKQWPDYPALTIDWKMPDDCQRVMIFEKLDYYLTHMCNQSQADEKVKEAGTAFKPHISKIKELYRNYLPMYREQVESLLQVGSAQVHEEFKEVPVEHFVGEQGYSDEHSPKSKSSNSRDATEQKSPLVGKSGFSSKNVLLSSMASSAPTEDRDEKKFKALEQSKQKIVRMTYGSQGFLMFLDDLFFMLQDRTKPSIDVRAMKEDAFNYFFLVKDMFNRLEAYQKNDNNSASDGDSIFCQTPEEQAYITRRFEEASRVNNEQKDREQVVKSNQVKNGHETNFYCRESVVERCPFGKCLGQADCKEWNNPVHKKVCPEKHVAPSMWMMPQGWFDHHARMRISQQYLMIKIKLTSKFEDKVDASDNAFYHMLKWPAPLEKQVVSDFPLVRLHKFLEELPLVQKETIVKLMRQMRDNHGIIQVDTCLKIFQAQIQLERDEEKAATTTDFKKRKDKIYTLKDKIFERADIDLVIEERKRKEEEFKEQQRKAAEEAKRRESNAIPRQTLTNYSNDVKKQIEKNKQEKKERQGFFGGLFGGSSKEKNNKNESQLSKAKTEPTKSGLQVMTPVNETHKTDPRQKNPPIMSPVPSNNTSSEYSKSPSSMRTSNEEETKSGTFNCDINGSVSSYADFRNQSDLWKRQADIQQREAQPQDQQQFTDYHQGEKYAGKLLQKMIQFFKDSFVEFGEMDHRDVKEEVKQSRLQQLMEIKNKVRKMKDRRYVFNLYTKNEQEIETIKQCFWLNILNFMTLFKLAEIKLTTPGVIRQLKLFPIWQAFMKHNHIEITGQKLSQQQIYHKVIRHNLALPGITLLTMGILSDPALEITNPLIVELFVQQPNKFISYGFFLPIRRMPMLQVYRKETLDQQLKCQVKVVNAGQLSADAGNFLIGLPKWMKWYHRDLAEMEGQLTEQQSTTPLALAGSSEQSEGRRQRTDANELNNRSLLQILEMLCSNNVMSDDEKVSDQLSKVVALMKKEVAQGRSVHKFNFLKVKWEFDSRFLIRNIEKALEGK